MEYREVGLSGVKVSALALGTMNFGSDWHGTGAVDERKARELLALAADAGVSLIDTADIYGRGAAERLLGKLLKGRRSKFVLATKVLGEMRPGDPSSGGLSARHIREALDASLRRLRTDHVDLYMPHAPDPKTPLEESLEAFHKAVRAGKVRALGVSNFHCGDWERCVLWAKRRRSPRFEFDQVQLSLAHPYPGQDLAPMVREHGVSVLAWSPLAGGFLTDKSRKAARAGKRAAGRRKHPESAFPPVEEARLAGLLGLLAAVARREGLTMAQTAAGWLLGKDWVSSVVLGARCVSQLKETLASRRLSSDSMSVLDRAASAVLRAG